jgi:hypothetical protein
MDAITGHMDPRQLPVLLRGEVEPINRWIERWSANRLLFYVGVIILGSASFGAAMGSWRAPEQALYCAIKLPLVVLLTTVGNGLLNGLLAPLLGLNLRFRQSLLSVLMSFALCSVVLGSFSPVVWFLGWNAPAQTESVDHGLAAHRTLLLTEVAAIALAGLAANTRLLQLLHRLSGSAVVARRIFFSWLAGNLLLGGQISWILRPFTGSPNLPVEFLRSNALHGNFFEALFQVLKSWFS